MLFGRNLIENKTLSLVQATDYCEKVLITTQKSNSKIYMAGTIDALFDFGHINETIRQTLYVEYAC